MTFDELGLLITNEPAPGCYGDSCAETSRYELLLQVTLLRPHGSSFHELPLAILITDKGILRHPLSPWREDDTSQDQKLPLFLALDARFPELLPKYLVYDTFWRLKRMIGIKTVAQALIFKFPWRWNDGFKKFERSSGSSADYLNFIAQLNYAFIMDKENWLTRLAMRLVPAAVAKAKIADYYQGGVNNQWLIDRYMEAIDIVWDEEK